MDAIIGALKSKTVWTGVVGILLTALSPVVQDWISAHPGIAGTVAGTVMILLRTLTTQSLGDKAAG